MFFHLFGKKRKKEENIQKEYVDLILTIINSPLWDGTDEEIRAALPADLTAETISYARGLSSGEDL